MRLNCFFKYIWVWGGGGGGAILANFLPIFLNPLVFMWGCLDRQIDNFFNEGFI